MNVGLPASRGRAGTLSVAGTGNVGRMDFSAYDPSLYLGEDSIIDLSHENVRTLSRQLSRGLDDDVAFARRAFEHVRDAIGHSFDVSDPRVSVTASDAVVNGVGLCHAKAHLLVALLRSRAIPAGLCYQRLGGPARGYVIHGLVAFWIHDGWHRVDPRGNKPGVDSQFSLTEERLAWAVNPGQGEIDYPAIHMAADPTVIAALQSTQNILNVNLPEALRT